MKEIRDCASRIEEDCRSTNPELLPRFEILPLHSSIPRADQKKVFRPCGPGKSTKIILATNIAESSLTIDDAVAVIDTGLVRNKTFDDLSSISSMETSMASKVSCQQRLGRVGRVAPGTCYRLYSRGDLEAAEDRPTPEMLRTSLEGTCLSICALVESNPSLGGIRDVLKGVIDPPPDDAVERALENLERMGAITATFTGGGSGERLTNLGRCLSRLPLDPSIGKMLVYGVVMKCLDPILTAAAAESSGGTTTITNAFGGSRDGRNKTTENASSDLEGTIQAFNDYWEIHAKRGGSAARKWAFEHSMNPQAMVSMRAVRRQLEGELVAMGLIQNGRERGRGRKNPKAREDRSSNSNLHGDCELLVRALWCIGGPENLAARRRTVERLGSLATGSGEKAFMHPKSALFFHRGPRSASKTGSGGGSDNQEALPEWYWYREMVRTSQVFLRGCCSLLPEQILLFGGTHLDVKVSSSSNSSSINNPSNIRGILDGWIIVEANGEEGEEAVDMLIRAREAIERIAERKLARSFSEGASRRSHNKHTTTTNDNDESDDLVINGIREFFDGLEDGRIVEPEPSPPSNHFHDYFLETDDAGEC